MVKVQEIKKLCQIKINKSLQVWIKLYLKKNKPPKNEYYNKIILIKNYIYNYKIILKLINFFLW